MPKMFSIIAPPVRKRLPFAIVLAGTWLVMVTIAPQASAQGVSLPEGSDAVPDARPAKGNWRVAVGAGVRLRPSYEGSDRFKVSPVPFVSVDWKDRIFLEPERGLGVYALRTENLRLGMSIGMAPGRSKDDDRRLRGLDKIGPGARGRVFGFYTIGMLRLGLDVTKDFGGGDGLMIRPSAALQVPLTDSLKLSTGASLTWANDKHMQAFFGISPSQAQQTRYQRFDAKAGIKSADLQVGLAWAMSEHWFMQANVGLKILLGDAADSPLTRKRVAPSAGVVLGYRF
ncbi:MipA/OmpV family protein [Reyranella sp. CPCC 100927]|uniref:MipA/OmpV family protein n=1 Tax=Reyranella sp. CPCC 100927 TaxID=2599616 RepID=UPI0011B6AD65|nr:MipA/OmpV family protein [Reyranella sp. CPCC 100927]TWT03760.1 MipA/OmpV family protein [Reyranella sp. CPCC 100927]